MVADCGEELRSDNIAYISLWPGIIKTEIIKNAVDVSTMPVSIYYTQCKLLFILLQYAICFTIMMHFIHKI